MFKKKTLKDIDVKGKKVLVREDLNVPLKDGQVADDTRIVAVLPTVRYLLDKGAAVIIMSHMGRPGGKYTSELSLKPVAEYLSQLLGISVAFSEDCIGKSAQSAAKQLQAGQVLLLENTRFHEGEESNDPEMGKELASLGDIFVSDAFGTSHRAHASNVGIADYLPAVAGLLMEKEIKYLGSAIDNPDRPFVAILGGAKVSDKIGVINNLLKKVDEILIGGGMANTFFAAQGLNMADSLVEEGSLDVAKNILQKSGDKLVLPVDFVIADAFSNDASKQTVEIGDVPSGWRVLDIGDKTVRHFEKYISEANTIVWNGPMGVFEFPEFAQGTFEIGRLVAASNAVSIIGGGDSASAIKKAGLENDITHISTGGGASLKMLEGAKLPGLEALEDN